MKHLSDVLPTTRPWATVHSMQLKVAYWYFVRHAAPVETFPQLTRYLESEGDVADLIYGNVLAPLCQIINSMMKPDLGGSLQVVIQQHPTYSAELVKNVSPDHAVVIRRRRLAKCDVPERPIVLVVIKEKAAGFLKFTKKAEKEKEHWTQYLPQLYMYSAVTACPESLLTDYVNSVAVILEQAADASEGITYSSRRVQRATKQVAQAVPDPVEEGLRHAICFLAFRALYRLGALRKIDKLGLHPVSDTITDLVTSEKRYRADEDLKNTLETARMTPRRASKHTKEIEMAEAKRRSGHR